METRAINLLKGVLADEGKTNKWLAEKLQRNVNTVSRWCRNEVQPPVETMAQIAQLLNIDIKDLLNSSK